jgi:Na+-translocating ferredoxin:NAD+ oxidoreductase subunit C
MNRVVKSKAGEVEKPQRLPKQPKTLKYMYKGLRSCVKLGETVSKGAPVAKGRWQTLHAGLAGVISSVTDDIIVVDCRNTSDTDDVSKVDNAEFLRNTPVDFAIQNGFIGMGGAGFPSAIKWKISEDIDTLVINSVECEPYASVDQSLLLHCTQNVLDGAKAMQEALNIKNVILAVKKSFLKQIRSLWDGEILTMSDRYPGGAERLIIGKLTKKPLPAGEFPSTRGFLVHNTTTIYSVGKSLKSGMPITERPISVIDMDNKSSKEWFVPIGTVLKDFIDIISLNIDMDKKRIIAGGVMMGQELSLDSTIDKNTTAITIVTDTKRLLRNELPCTACGSCNDICPLGLHPIELARRIRTGEMQSKAFHTQLNECFLCGACSAVCPSDIPLADIIREERKS